MVEVEPERLPEEGEVILITGGGSFMVKGSPLEAAKRLAAEEWPTFELAESGDSIIIRSSKVIAIRGSSRHRRGTIGFTHRS